MNILICKVSPPGRNIFKFYRFPPKLDFGFKIKKKKTKINTKREKG